jgi:hypothetical protein
MLTSLFEFLSSSYSAPCVGPVAKCLSDSWCMGGGRSQFRPIIPYVKDRLAGRVWIMALGWSPLFEPKLEVVRLSDRRASLVQSGLKKESKNLVVTV